MFYIYAENLEFYESLPNKSEFVNAALEAARTKGVVGPKEVKSPLQSAQDALTAMERRDQERFHGR
jgi:hypothetical protein